MDGLDPKILWHTYYYSYACEREDVPDSEFVDGMTNFEYRQEVCGNAPKPDNTNVQIKGFEAESTDAFYFGCNIFASERYVGKMSNILNTKKMPCKYQITFYPSSIEYNIFKRHTKIISWEHKTNIVDNSRHSLLNSIR